MFNRIKSVYCKVILIIFSIVLLAGCNEISKHDVSNQSSCAFENNYLVYYFDEVNKELIYHFNYLDCNGKIEKSKSYSLDGDIAESTFDYENDYIYMYGEAGLYYINLHEKELVYLAEGLVSSFVIKDGLIVYVDNIGFAPSSSQYSTDLYLLNDDGTKTHISSLDYPVGDLEINDEKIYVTNLPITQSETVFVDEYSFSGDLLNRYSIHDWGVFETLNETVYLKSVGGLYDFINDDEILFNKELLSPYDYIINDEYLTSLEYDVYSSTCNYSSSEYITFDNCYGYREISNEAFLIAIDDSLYILDKKDGSIKMSGITDQDVWRYYFVAY